MSRACDVLAGLNERRRPEQGGQEREQEHLGRRAEIELTQAGKLLLEFVRAELLRPDLDPGHLLPQLDGHQAEVGQVTRHLGGRDDRCLTGRRLIGYDPRHEHLQRRRGGIGAADEADHDRGDRGDGGVIVRRHHDTRAEQTPIDVVAERSRIVEPTTIPSSDSMPSISASAAASPSGLATPMRVSCEPPNWAPMNTTRSSGSRNTKNRFERSRNMRTSSFRAMTQALTKWPPAAGGARRGWR